MRCKVDFIWQLVTTNSVVGLRSSKTLPKAKLAPKKGHGHCSWAAASLIHYRFLNPGKTTTSEKYTQQIDEMCWKLQRLQPELVNRKGPVLLRDNAWPHVTQSVLWKLNELRYVVLPHPPYSPALSPTDQPLLQASQQLFAGKALPQPKRGRKCFLRVYWIPKHGFLCCSNRQTFLVGKNIIVMVAVLMNKDAFEPSNNDLKFTVQNCSYFCTNVTQCEFLSRWCRMWLFLNYLITEYFSRVLSLRLRLMRNRLENAAPVWTDVSKKLNMFWVWAEKRKFDVE